MRVLVCDDDDVCRRMLCSKLKKHEYEIVGEAETGLEALNLFMQRRPDIVLLDIKMPMGSGLTVLRFIREVDTNAKIIMLSADRTSHAVNTALKLGANDYLVKGQLNTDRLLEALGHRVKKT